MDIQQNALKDEEEGYNKQIIKLNEKIIKLNADSGVSIDELEKRLGTLKTKLDEIKTTKSGIQQKITQREELQVTLEEMIDGFDEELFKYDVLFGCFIVFRSSCLKFIFVWE